MINPIEYDLALSINSYYVGEERSGLRSCERGLLSNPPYHIENNLKQNYTFYMPKLADLEGVTFVDLNIPPYNPGWGVFNPTLIQKDLGHYVLVRNANYEIVDGRYHIKDSSNNTIYTRYQLLSLNEKDEIESISSIDSEPYEKSNFPADGIEDVRLFKIDHQYYVSGTIRNMLPYTDKARIAVGKLNVERSFMHDIKLLESPVSHDKHEKNWMPILGSECPEWLYECNNGGWTDVIQYKDGSLNIISRNLAPNISKSFRGGGQLVKVGDSYFAIVHEVVILHDSRRNYFHRFVKFNSRMAIEDYSIPFFLKEKHTIEFVSGLAFDDMTETFRITFGIMDREAWICKLSLSFLNDFMRVRHEVMNEKKNLF